MTVSRRALYFAALTTMASVPGYVYASPVLINNASVSIADHFASFPGDNSHPLYVVEHAIDAAGAATFYCTESGATSTFITFKFSAPTSFDSVRYTGSYPSCSGDVTGFKLDFSNV